MKPLTPEQVRQRHRRTGKPLSQWAKENGYRPDQVYRVMAGIDKGYYGMAHEIAIKLGLKAPASENAA